MPDIIHILPDNVANQIAAGEVIQRPASAVKELMENAIDAGATFVKLIIKEAGRTLLQVIDNGCGMSETDARLSFERHATSKIREANDLFCIRTMGFRGEALASVAAVAQVEMKTRRIGDETGTHIVIEGTEVKSQEACSCAEGTSISIKNLFFNVPARRNFLKSNTIETSHIYEEFNRVALSYPHVAFELYNNNAMVFHLENSPLKQRIINLFGNNYNQKLLPVDQKAGYFSVSGFVGKPEAAKKTRGEQYFFVNGRFFKHSYLHHAVSKAFEELIPEKAFPSYFLYIEIDPQEIDINIHPTKTEIKFQDEKTVYAIMRSAVKQSLGLYSATPSLDFEIERSFDIIPLPKGQTVAAPVIKIDPDFNPFKTQTEQREKQESILPPYPKDRFYSRHADSQMQLPVENSEKTTPIRSMESDMDNQVQEARKGVFMQLHNAYIVTQVKSGLLIVDQQNAHERILYEEYLEILTNQQAGAQQKELFPQMVEFSAVDSVLLLEIIDEVRHLGFDISGFGANSYVINGTPCNMPESDLQNVLEGLLEQYKQSKSDLSVDKKEKIARAMAVNTALKHGQILKSEEMISLIDRLFACKVPYHSPEGKSVLYIMSQEELANKFN
jgi:DNA mismatch repair protein MutL